LRASTSGNSVAFEENIFLFSKVEKNLYLPCGGEGYMLLLVFFLTWCEDCSKRIILSRTTLFLLLPFPFACREPKKKYAWNLYRENFFASTRCALLLLASAIFFQLASATYLLFCIQFDHSLHFPYSLILTKWAFKRAFSLLSALCSQKKQGAFLNLRG